MISYFMSKIFLKFEICYHKNWLLLQHILQVKFKKKNLKMLKLYVKRNKRQEAKLEKKKLDLWQ